MNEAIINVAALLRRPGTPSTWQLKYNMNELEFYGRSICFAEPIDILCVCCYDGESITVEGNLKAFVSEVCARCSSAFILSLECEFKELFTRVGDGSVDNSCATHDYYAFEGEAINLHELIRDTILLQIPLSSACSHSCKGLCPICGVNLNTEQCSCGRNAVEPDTTASLRTLSELLNQLREKEEV